MNNAFFTICSLIYIILLMIVFFLRKKIFKLENKIYSVLIISNFIGLIMELFSYILLVKDIDVTSVFYTSLTKCIICYYLIWISLFTLYVYVISRNEKEIKDNFYSIWNKFLFMEAFLIIAILVLPIKFNLNENIYPYGMCIYTMYFISSICILIMLIIMIKNIKNIMRKKFIPLFSFLILGIFVMTLQALFPSVILLTSCETFITFLMYFTIENPDLQMLKEFHKARELAEESNKEKTEFLFNISNC